MPNQPFILDYNFGSLQEMLRNWGEPDYRVNQVWQGLYLHLWQHPEEMSGGQSHKTSWSTLPKKLRTRLIEYFSFSHLMVLETLNSIDHETSKTLFALPDDYGIETVLMRYQQTKNESINRHTICISAQSGCAMGCVFCATGQMGFMKNLSAGEMVEQVIYFARQLQNEGEGISNVVVMGMGEPFLNYDNTLKAIEILNHSQGFNLGQRRFTISTVGIIPQIERFISEHRQINLAVSLHAADNDLRSALLPINKKYPLHDLLKTCRKYSEETKRRITFEWALLEDVNDSEQQAKMLCSLISNMLCHVNLIPLNPTNEYKKKGSDPTSAKKFLAVLENNGIPATLRFRRGLDIRAGCGQLMTEFKKNDVEFQA